ncbi:Hsp20/alpha crystallin family protein [Streptomyces umbrinus]
MTTPVRRHRGGAVQDRPLGWARNPLTEFDQLFSEMIELPGVKSKDINVEANGQELVVMVTGEIKEKARKGVLRFYPCLGGPSATDPQNSKISDKVRLRRRLVPAK